MGKERRERKLTRTAVIFFFPIFSSFLTISDPRLYCANIQITQRQTERKGTQCYGNNVRFCLVSVEYKCLEFWTPLFRSIWHHYEKSRKGCGRKKMSHISKMENREKNNKKKKERENKTRKPRKLKNFL